MKKVLLEILQNSQEKICVKSLFFNKVAGPWHRCFPVNFVKILRTPFLQNTSGRVLLELEKIELIMKEPVQERFIPDAETVLRRYYVKKILLKISQNSLANTPESLF